MKTIFKSIIRFFILIWNFFFGKKVKEVAKLENTSAPMMRVSNQPIVPKHNNRKPSDARFIQYINVGEGRTRPIYHGAKK